VVAYCLALICFLLAAFNATVRVNLVGLGLALWVLVVMLTAAGVT
jgi:hypothetical protein